MSKPAKDAPAKDGPAHPTYAEMVAEAIKKLNPRKALSMAAISKYIGENFKVPANYPKQLSVQMRKMVEAGKLKKDKASYRLGDAMKEAAKPKRARMTGKEVEGETKKKMGEKKAAKRGSKKPAAEGGKMENDVPNAKKPAKKADKKSEGEKKVTKPKSTGVKKTGAKKPIGKEAPAKGAKKVVSKTPKSKAKAAADPKE